MTTRGLTRSTFADITTGEMMVGTLVPDNAGYSIRNAGQREMAAKMAKHYDDLNKDGRLFAMMYRDQPKLSLVNAGYIMKLLPYIALGMDGLLCGAHGDPLTFDEVAKIFGKQKRATITILQELENAGAITKGQNGRKHAYSVNPAICHVGAKQTAAPFVKFYKVQGRELLRKLKPSEAGLLFKLAPYLHFQKLVLCKNPDCDPIRGRIEAFSRDELAQELGIDVDTLKVNMQGLRRKGAILVTASLGRTNFYANPDIYFRGTEDEWSKSLRQQFRDLGGE